jgi:hypothetical protein
VTTPIQLLDGTQVLATVRRLHARIEERFPGSGLGRVAAEVQQIGQETAALVDYLARPHWPIRVAAGLMVGLLIVAVIALLTSLRLPSGIDGIGEALQASESLINDVVFLGIAVYFLVGLELRAKRRRALRSLHRLRSVAHIVDMHQLTKDPHHVHAPADDTASSPKRTLTAGELGRYLDYCSELLSCISKLAAMHGQKFDDSITLSAVNDVEGLCMGLSSKIWQKITIIARH